MFDLLFTLGRAIALKLPPETAHTLGKWVLKNGIFAPGEHELLKSKLFGVELNGVLGIAPGFCKDCDPDFIDALPDWGFSMVEVGSISYEPWKGNPKPRLYRIKENKILGNRMGLNNCGAKEARKRLEFVQRGDYAVSIVPTPGKTGDAAIEDVCATFKEVCGLSPVFVGVNVSCPNTSDAGEFTKNTEHLEKLLHNIGDVNAHLRTKLPIVLKLGPDMLDFMDNFRWVIEKTMNYVDGYEFCNTMPTTDPNRLNGQQHGQSGAMVLRAKTRRGIKFIKEIVGDSKTLIAVGGIETAEDVKAVHELGAAHCLAYTGIVYGMKTPSFAVDLNREYEKL